MKYQVQEHVQFETGKVWVPAIQHAPALAERDTHDEALTLLKKLTLASPQSTLRVEPVPPAIAPALPRVAPTPVTKHRGTYQRKLQQCYVMHKLNDPDPAVRAQNLRDAALWCCWLAECFYVAPVANWIVLASVWPETMRERGLEIDFSQISIGDMAMGVGPVMSPGMRLEGAHATEHHVPVFDMTGLNIHGIHPHDFMRLAKTRGYDFSTLVRP